MQLRYVLIYVLTFTLTLGWRESIWAHPGPTDIWGCHTCVEDCECWSDIQKGVYHCHEFKGKIHPAPVVHSTYQCGNNPSNTHQTNHYGSTYYSSYYVGSGGSDPGAALAATFIILGGFIVGAAIYSAATHGKNSFKKYRERYVQLMQHDLTNSVFPSTQEGKYLVTKDTCNWKIPEAYLFKQSHYEQTMEQIGMDNMLQSHSARDRLLAKRQQKKLVDSIYQNWQQDHSNYFYLFSNNKPYEVKQVMQIMEDGTILSKMPYVNKPEDFCYGGMHRSVKNKQKKNKIYDKVELFCKFYDMNRKKAKHCQVKFELDKNETTVPF